MDLMKIIRELENEGNSGRFSVIKRILNEEGINYSATPDVHFDQKIGKNVNLTNIIVPSDRKKVVGIGSHYDVVRDSPGADDNGSAVAVSLDVLMRLKRNPLNNLGVSFFFFDLEEERLLGSKSYVSRFGKNNLIAFYNMELVGIGNELAFWDVNEESNALLWIENQAKKMKIPYHRIGEVLVNSADHLSFRPVLGENAFTITAMSSEDYGFYKRFKLESEGKNLRERISLWKELILGNSPKFQHYHKSTDSSANINPLTLQKVSDVLYNTIVFIDKALANQ
jgi:hypothetical protein